MSKDSPRTSVLRDNDLIRRGDALDAAWKADSLELSTHGAGKIEARINAIPAVQPTVSPELLATTNDVAVLVEALEGLIQQTYDCEKELTEDLHHMDFCGESDPLAKARATLAEIKGESRE